MGLHDDVTTMNARSRNLSEEIQITHLYGHSYQGLAHWTIVYSIVCLFTLLNSIVDNIRGFSSSSDGGELGPEEDDMVGRACMACRACRVCCFLPVKH